jgi:hypothetical protein
MKLYHRVTGGNINVPAHRVEAMAKKGWLPEKKKKIKVKVSKKPIEEIEFPKIESNDTPHKRVF